MRREQRNDHTLEHWTEKVDFLLKVLGFIAVILGIFLVLRQMKQTESALGIAREANVIAKKAQEKSDADSLSQESRFNKQFDLSIRNTKAAENSSSIAKANIEGLKSTQRAWVWFGKIELDNDIELNKTSKIDVYVTNSGPTAATDAVVVVQMGGIFSLKTPPKPFFPKADDASVAIIPAGTKYERGPDGEGSGILVSAELAFGNSSEIAAYRSGSSAVYVFAKVIYKDIFNSKVVHESTLCAYHLYGEAKYEWSYCRDGNVTN